MPSVRSARAQAIDAYMQENPACQINNAYPMEFGDKVTEEPVFLLPIRLLCYNLKNGRYSVELAKLQADEGYELDPTRPEDHRKLRDLLLSLDPEQTAFLRQDLEDRGQIYPGVITENGFVINANRRMAVLEELHERHPGGKYEKLKVQRLPPGVDDRDLWRLEAGLQLSRDARADYSPINVLLKLREGQKAGLSASELGAALYGRRTAWVEQSLARLDIMDQYLAYVGDAGSYHLLDGTDQQFIELQNNMTALANNDLDEVEQYNWLICQFEMIGAGIGNWNMRLVKKIALDDDASERLREDVIDKALEGSRPSRDDIRQAFSAAQATIESKEEANQPSLLLAKAIAAVSAINTDSPHLLAGKNKYLFNKLRQQVRRLEGPFS